MLIEVCTWFYKIIIHRVLTTLNSGYGDGEEKFPTWLRFLENFLLLFSNCSFEHKLFLTI